MSKIYKKFLETIDHSSFDVIGEREYRLLMRSVVVEKIDAILVSITKSSKAPHKTNSEWYSGSVLKKIL